MTLDSARRSNTRDKASNGGSTTPSSRRWVLALPVVSKVAHTRSRVLLSCRVSLAG